jgi:TfoX/Sxy family transcriptional regulator of competence genes
VLTGSSGKKRLEQAEADRDVAQSDTSSEVVLDMLLSAVPDATCRTMFGCPAYFIDGKMFACVYGDSLAMKLPEDFANDLLSAGRATAFQPYDKAPMRERVQIDRADPPDYRLDLAIIRAAADFARLRKTGRRAT